MDPFVGQLALFPFPFAPHGWALCQGQLLPITQNTALFTLIGTYFGGDGVSNFALPDLQGRVPLGQGNGPGLSPYVNGQQGGFETVTLTAPQSPAHVHPFYAFVGTATAGSPAGALPAEAVTSGRGGQQPVNLYATSGTATSLATSLVGSVAGQGAPHNNLQPFLAMSWCIALTGIFPPRQ